MTTEEKLVWMAFNWPDDWLPLMQMDRDAMKSLSAPYGAMFGFLERQCPTTVPKLRRTLWGFKWGKQVKTIMDTPTDLEHGPLEMLALIREVDLQRLSDFGQELGET